MMNAAWNNSPPALSAESLLAVWKRDVRSSQDGDEFLRIVLEDRDGAYPIAGWAIRVVQAVCDRVRTKRAELDANAARVLASWSPTVALTQTFNFNFDQQQPVQQQPVPQAVPLPGFNLPWHEQQLLSDAIAYRRKRLQNNLKIVPKTIRLRRKSVSPARPAAQSVSTEPAPVLIPQEVAMPQKRRAKRGRRGRAKRVPPWKDQLFNDYRNFRATHPDCLPKQMRHKFGKLFADHAPKQFRPLPMPPPSKLLRGLSNAEASETRDKAMRERERAILKKERELRHSCNKLYKQGIKRDAARIKHPA